MTLEQAVAFIKGWRSDDAGLRIPDTGWGSALAEAIDLLLDAAQVDRSAQFVFPMPIVCEDDCTEHLHTKDMEPIADRKTKPEPRVHSIGDPES